MSDHGTERIGIVYLARGADNRAREKFKAFANSYRSWDAGADHQLHVVFKGFSNAEALIEGQEALGDLDYCAHYLDDVGYDLGAYFAIAERVKHEYLCFLNTASRICGPNWLAKLAANLMQPDVGMVSCTASFEAPQHPGLRNVAFPNPHLRSNAFMIRRDRFIALRPKTPLKDKIDVYLLEHGPDSIARCIASRGLKTLLVGRNGRGYEPANWPISRTFRQGSQDNLLIADNQTDAFEAAPVPEKRVLFHLAWGNRASRNATTSTEIDADEDEGLGEAGYGASPSQEEGRAIPRHHIEDRA